MEKHKAIPEGYMTVGQMAKKMDVTVRTLQHYDREGLLSPSAISDGGRRLYTDKDIIKLHQILSLKHLGFSLDDIKNRLVSLDTPQEVADALAEQAQAVQRKMESLSRSLRELELLREEVLQMQTVDFKKYADIIVNLQMENDFYWLIKHFDDQTLDHIRSKFDRERLIPSMTVFGVSMSALIGLPPSLVEIYGSDIKKVYRANGVPVYLGLVLTNLSAFLHLLLMSVILFFAAPLVFDAALPGHPGVYFWGLSVFTAASLSVASIVGLAVKDQGKTSMISILIFLPSILLSGIMFPAGMLPGALEMAGKLFPASWGYLLMAEDTLRFEYLWPLLLIFGLADCVCAVLAAGKRE